MERKHNRLKAQYRWPESTANEKIASDPEVEGELIVCEKDLVCSTSSGSVGYLILASLPSGTRDFTPS